MRLRPETRERARALQLLYAWDVQGRPPIGEIAQEARRLCGAQRLPILERAEALARAVAADREALDQRAGAAAEHWRLERMAVVERNILRLGIHELSQRTTPPKVVIDEAVRLAHWFGGAQSSSFINGILDRIAHELGRL
jgi:N utilization substance protein B